MTVSELMNTIEDLLKSGEIKPDTKVIVSDDEEGNGFHAPYYVEGFNKEDEEDVAYGLEDVDKALII